MLSQVQQAVLPQCYSSDQQGREWEIKSIIGKLAMDHLLQWDKYLNAVSWVVKESVSKTIGLSP